MEKIVYKVTQRNLKLKTGLADEVKVRPSGGAVIWRHNGRQIGWTTTYVEGVCRLEPGDKEYASAVKKEVDALLDIRRDYPFVIE